jgi:hypothetical protein
LNPIDLVGKLGKASGEYSKNVDSYPPKKRIISQLGAAFAVVKK